jgi:hypothetical protein
MVATSDGTLRSLVARTIGCGECISKPDDDVEDGALDCLSHKNAIQERISL